MLGTSSEAYTTTTPSTLGTMWRQRYSLSIHPTCAASINSFAFKAQRLATYDTRHIQPETMPMATKINRMFWPKKVTSRITKNMNGKEFLKSPADAS